MTPDIIRHQLDKARAEYDFARNSVRTEKASLKAARSDLAHTLAAQKITQEAAEAVQRTAHTRIAAVVSRCLQAVFGDDAYHFRIDFQQARGKTEARLELERDGLVLDDPLEQAGGGVMAVASFALQISCLLLSTPKRRRLLIIDEPFSALSEQYRPAVRALLQSLAADLGVQIIMVTHSKALMIGKVIQLGESE